MAVDHCKALKQYLENQGFSNVYATDFSHVQEDKCIILIPNQGFKPQDFLNGGNEVLTNDGVKVICRDKSTKLPSCRKRAKEVRKTLHNSQPKAADIDEISTDYCAVRTRGNVTTMGRDEDNRPRFGISLIAQIRE